MTSIIPTGYGALAEGDGQLIAAGRNWDLYVTSDGNTWQSLTHPNMDKPEGRFEAIHYDNGIWAAVGSTDLKTFSTVTRGIGIKGDRGGFEHHFRKELPNKYYRLKK